MTKISTVIIAKNEADRITKTIESTLGISDEVLVLDTGSSDNTVKLSMSSGATVIKTAWKGYGATKNYGCSLAKNDWILSLDADEVISKELQKELKNINLKKGTVYLLNRIVFFENKWIHHAGWHPDWVYRLYHKDECNWNNSLVHEKLVFKKNVSTRRLNGLLEHYSYRDIDHFKEKINQYAKLTAKQWVHRGKKPSFLKRHFGKYWKYLKIFYFQKGYKYGAIGKLIASVHAEGVEKKIKYFDELRK